MKKIIIAGLMLFFGTSLTIANAALVTLNSTQNQTVSGENFNFNFTGLAASDGTGGTFVLHAQGDYDGGSNETLAWDIDGLLSQSAVGGFINGTGGLGGPFDFATVFQPLGNIEFQRTYAISAAVLNSILADGMLNIFIDLASSVNLFNPPNFVEVTLSYNTGVSNVPVPAALFMFAPALLGFLGLRRRTKNTIV
jgi:hypothetical protein